MYHNWSTFMEQNGQTYSGGRHAWESWDVETNSNSGGINYPLNHSLYPPPGGSGGFTAPMQLGVSSPFFREEGRGPQIYYNLDPHLMCLKLGKRQYFEDVTRGTYNSKLIVVGDTAAIDRGTAVEMKGKTSYYESQMAPRCQVEGCETVLVNAKGYHRRHKVCEMHAKAPKVVLLGIEQRFCQQCSRFHAVEEFDESKRSCRQRLAGHNERRRKSSLNQPYFLDRKLPQGIHHHPPDSLSSSSECALSLLSSRNFYNPWNHTASQDLPSRCSAALRDLIAENRAKRQQLETFNPGSDPRQSLTLDLMQDPNSPFVHFRNRLPSSGGGEDGNDFWQVPSEY